MFLLDIKIYTFIKHDPKSSPPVYKAKNKQKTNTRICKVFFPLTVM